MQMKYRITDMMAAYGAAEINQCSQVISEFNSLLIKPIATMF